MTAFHPSSLSYDRPNSKNFMFPAILGQDELERLRIVDFELSSIQSNSWVRASQSDARRTLFITLDYLPVQEPPPRTLLVVDGFRSCVATGDPEKTLENIKAEVLRQRKQHFEEPQRSEIPIIFQRAALSICAGKSKLYAPLLFASQQELMQLSETHHDRFRDSSEPWLSFVRFMTEHSLDMDGSIDIVLHTPNNKDSFVSTPLGALCWLAIQDGPSGKRYYGSMGHHRFTWKRGTLAQKAPEQSVPTRALPAALIRHPDVSYYQLRDFSESDMTISVSDVEVTDLLHKFEGEILAMFFPSISQQPYFYDANIAFRPVGMTRCAVFLPPVNCEGQALKDLREKMVRISRIASETGLWGMKIESNNTINNTTIKITDVIGPSGLNVEAVRVYQSLEELAKNYEVLDDYLKHAGSTTA